MFFTFLQGTKRASATQRRLDRSGNQLVGVLPPVAEQVVGVLSLPARHKKAVSCTVSAMVA